MKHNKLTRSIDKFLLKYIFRCNHVFKVKDDEDNKLICIKCLLIKKRDDIKYKDGGI
jgi:hypothetical protein